MQGRKSPSVIARPPQDFATLLAGDEPLFLVGGQAVNLWALYYNRRTAELSPFVSRDIDVIGDRNTLCRIAKSAGVEPQFFPMRPPSNEIGAIIAKSADGQPLVVQVLTSMHGVSNEVLRNPEYTIGIGDGEVLVRVPGPIALLKAKIANVADIPQLGRQDERHVRILAKLMPAYLADIHASVIADRISKRGMIDLLERLLAAVTSRKAIRVIKDLGICRMTMFSELKPEPSSKLHAFINKRLARALRGAAICR